MRTLVLLAVLVSGCDTVDDRPAEWSYLHAAIIVPSCATASCHSQISSVSGRDMSTRHAAYTALTGRVCGAPVLGSEVPLAEQRDKILGVLRGNEGPRMPPDQPLAEVEIELIERWFAAGAPCD